MSDDSQEATESNSSSGSNEPTPLGDNSGVYIPSTDEEEGEGEDISIDVPLDFGGFVVSLGTSVMVNLGRVEHPETGGTELDLDSARHTIGILEMLKEKTAGNLSDEEQNLLDSLLQDVRMAYVAESGEEA